MNFTHMTLWKIRKTPGNLKKITLTKVFDFGAIKNQYNNYDTWFFTCLLAQVLVKCPHFYLRASLIGSVIGLALDRTVLMEVKVTVNLFRIISVKLANHFS